MSRPFTPADRARLATAADQLAGAPVLVVGDPMLDRFLVGRVTRISPEAPVPVVAFDHQEQRLGGAANVAANLAALGGRPRLIGLVGKDEAADALVRALETAGLDAAGLVADPDRRTTLKVRVVTERRQQVARIDYEAENEAAGAVEDQLLARAAELARGVRAILVSDYLKGTVTARLMTHLGALARQEGIPLLVDPKVPHLAYYRGADLVTPNQTEAEAATHQRIRTDEEARAASRTFRERVGCHAVLITRGEHGMWLSGTEEGSLPAVTREVADVTGAGDTVIATLALALSTGATLGEAAVLASHAAGLVVARFGPVTVTADELQEAIERI